MKVLIDTDGISQLASSTKIYMRGRNIFNAKQRIGPLYYDANKYVVSAKISSLSGNVYDTFLQLNSNGTLAGAACSCKSFGIYKGPCKHVIALLFNLTEVELPDDGQDPLPLKEDDYLYGRPSLRQPILSFDVLERITGPDKKRSRRGSRPQASGPSNRDGDSENANTTANTANRTEEFLKDETVGGASGESEFVKIKPGQSRVEAVEEEEIQIVDVKPRLSGGEELIKQLKFWSHREDNLDNSLEDVLALDRLCLFEITVSLRPGHSNDSQLSLRVGVKDHLYVVNRIGEFLEKVKSREAIEFGSYFTWHKKQTLTKKQSDFLTWLDLQFKVSQNRAIADMTANEIALSQDALDSKTISLSAVQLKSLFELSLQNEFEIDVNLELGNREFPMVWRTNLPNELSIFMDLIEEDEATDEQEASVQKAASEDEETKRNEKIALDLRLNNAHVNVLRLDDLGSIREFQNSVLIMPTYGVLLIDSVLYYVDSEADRLTYSIAEVLARENESVIKLTAPETSYMIGTCNAVLEDASDFGVSPALEEILINEKLATRTYLDYDGKRVNLSAFFHYGKYSFRPGYAEKKIISKEDNNDVVLIRDISSEKYYTRLLYDLGFNEANLKQEELSMLTKNEKGSYMANQYSLSGNEKIFHFIKGNVDSISEISRLLATPDFKKINLLKPGTASMTVDMSADDAYIRLEINIDGFESNAVSKIVQAFLDDKKFIKLDEYSFVDLSIEDGNWSASLEDLKSMVKTLESWEVKWEDNAFLVPKVRSLSLFAAIQDTNIEVSSSVQNASDAWNRLVEDMENPSLNAPELPDGVEATLRPYQVEGFHWLSYLERYGLGGILADEMGLGKTLQTLTFLWSLYQKEGGRFLIVAPTSLLYNWQKETEKFTPGMKARVITGTKPERIDQYQQFAKEDGIIIVSYGLVRQDRKELGQFTFDAVVIDEAQNIKNPMTKTSRNVKALKAKRRFALTGTPLENHIGELWSIFDFIMPGYLFTYSSFQDRFGILFKAPEVSKYSREELEALDKEELEEIVDGNYLASKASRESLRQLVSPFILRRLKKDVLEELPDKLSSNIPVPMTGQQQKIYREHLARARMQIAEYEESDTKYQNRQRMNILGELTRLRQICCHPSLFMNDYTGGSGKLEVLEDLVENLVSQGHRILIFSQFTKMLSLIRERQEALDRKIFYIDGQVKSEERLRLVDEFNSGEGEIFLISLKAGGTGLNLTGADVVIHYDPWWNPAVENQATDRAHRIGQEKDVQVFRLVTIGSIEEKIQDMQRAKEDLLDDIVSPGSTFINRLNMDDIKELFLD